MLKEERHKKIIEYLMKNKTVRTSFLSKQLEVSEVTIRKDLKQLEKENLLTKTHGGAVLERKNDDFPFDLRETEYIEEKKWIARKAVELIEKDDVVFLDAGTTIYQIARFIRKKNIHPLSVVTNSLQVANVLVPGEVDIKIIGGDIRKETFSIIGPDAKEYLEGLNVNKLFLGASGISREFGVTNTNIFEAELKQKMIDIAREVILVADSSKMDNLALNRVTDLEKIDVLITDKLVDRDFIKKITEEVAVIIAGDG